MNRSNIESSEPASCDALVTFTLLRNAEDFIQHRELSVKGLFDLSTLVDSIILHPRIVTIKGVIPDEIYPHQIIDFLNDNNLIYFYKPSYGTRELVTMMNQYSLFRNLAWKGFSWDLLPYQSRKQPVFESQELMDCVFLREPGPLESKRILEASTSSRFDESEIEALVNKIRSRQKELIELRINEIRSIRSKNKEEIESLVNTIRATKKVLPEDYNLFDAIHLMSTGHHLAFRQYLFRTVVYLCSADYDKLTFYPDYVRIPYVSSCVKRLYSNLSREVYERVAAAFNAKVGEILEEVPGTHLTLPPFLYIILEKMVDGANFFDALLDIRSQFESMRRQLGEIDSRIRNAHTLSEKRKGLKQKKELLEAITKKYGSGQGSRIKEFLSFAKGVARPMVTPQDPNAYNENLLQKPYEWIRDWWLRRPVTYLLDAVQRIERLPDVLDLVHKGFGYKMSIEEIKSFKDAKNSVVSLMRRYEASET